MILNQTLKNVSKNFSMTLMVAATLVLSGTNSFAQNEDRDATVNLEQIRWKSESQVRSLLGDPNSVHGPVGTHASYTLWKYDDFTIAFANSRAFHLFDKNSLKKFELQENR